MRSSANLDGYNEARTCINEKKVAAALATCERQKLKFESISAFATYLQDVTSIHRTTLLRNTRYRDPIEVAMGGPIQDDFTVPDDELTEPMLRTRLLALRAECSVLRGKLDTRNGRATREDERQARQAPESMLEHGSQFEDFSNTAIALLAILSRLRDSVTIDYASGEVLDLAAKPSERVIVGANRTSAFVNWAKKNPQLLLVLWGPS
jgi:hypothetical protein